MPTSATGSSPRLPRGRRPAPPRPRRGFTLIELLVVVLLIGIVTSLAVLSLRGDSPAERLEHEAARLFARMDFAREQAVLQARSLGLEVGSREYRFLELAEGSWRPLADTRMPALQELPDGTRIEAELEGIEIVLEDREEEPEDGDDELRPQIFFLASGEILPGFTLWLSGRETDVEFTIRPGDEQWLELVEHEG